MNIEEIKELRELTGASMFDCRKALEYANGDKEIGIAYIKAKYFSVKTPNLTFDERVKSFLAK